MVVSVTTIVSVDFSVHPLTIRILMILLCVVIVIVRSVFVSHKSHSRQSIIHCGLLIQ